VCDAGGRSLGFATRPRPEGASAADTLAALVSLAREVLGKHAPGGGAPAAVGWGFGGPVDRALNRPLVNYHEAGWERVDATGALAGALGAPVWVENDCKLAGLAEAHRGAGTPRGLMAYITLGSGIGGGLVWNGEILATGRFGEMEIGHLEIVPGGAPCPCGRKGCLEAYCSGWGLGERARERAAGASTAGTAVTRALLECEPRDRARVLLAGWPQDPFTREMAADFIGKLAPVCAGLVVTLAPARIVVGGGLSGAPWLIEAVAEAVAARLPPPFRGGTPFACARLGAAAVSFGAALHAARQLKGPPGSPGGPV
jgi:glucokinase